MTNTPEINRLLDDARVLLPGAIDSAIIRELFNTLHEFFTTTSCWYEDIDFAVVATDEPRATAPEMYTYTIQPVAGTIVRLMHVVTADGVQVPVTMQIPGEVFLGTSPSEDTTYTARAVLTVSEPTRSDGMPIFPDWVLRKYHTGIVDGLVGRLMAQPAKPYSNGIQSAVRLRRFVSCMSQARVDRTGGNVYGAQNWRFPRYGV